MLLHTFHDRSVLRRISARDLIKIPIWKGNRTIEVAHAEEIFCAIGGNVRCLDSSIFRIVKYMEMNASGALQEQKYIIDGQHRAYCIKKFFDETVCEPDFDIVVMEKVVDDETEAIEYFNQLNNVKPQHFQHDPAILANAYIAGLDKKFKHKLIRPGATKRPYLSADKLRDALKLCGERMKPGAENVVRFVAAVVAWNESELKTLEIRTMLPGEKEVGIINNCLEKKFALAFDSRLRWVRECLT